MAPVYVLFALLGLALGSFGNVLILRIRTAETLGGRSHCPHCMKTIAWFDLFPLLSFLLLGGRCRHCRKTISLQYPLVECASMLVFLLGIVLTPLDPFHALVTAFALYFLLLACVYDGMFQQIPDIFTICFALVVLADVWLLGDIGLRNAEPLYSAWEAPTWMGAAGRYVYLLLIGPAYSSRIELHTLGAMIPFAWFGLQWLVSRGKAVGTGDIFLGTAIGFWLGVQGSVVMLVLSYMVGAVVTLLLLITKTISLKRQRIPFGPFMGIATVLTVLGAGDLYLSLLR